jgi:SAM-dependent methyltransferase
MVVAGDYDVLAPVYNRIGMARFADEMTPRLLELAQRNGWLGRRILDVGCGTGTSMLWLVTHGYPAYGVDNSVAMLQQARQNLQQFMLDSHLIEADVRSLPPLDSMELVMALDVIPELESLRDLEAAFDSIASVLVAGSFFVFDLYTLAGLIRQGTADDTILHDDDGLLVFSRSAYDYERQICTSQYDLFAQTGDDCWQRQHARRVLRAYPLQGVASLLQRHGFEVVTVVDAHLEPLEVSRPVADRAIFACKKK